MIFDAIQEWFQELLIDGIISNLTGMFDTLNTKVGEIAGEVGMTPSAWNSGIFNMVRNLSETVIVPIAGIVLTFVMCYELIQLIVEKNNLHDFDTWIFFKWIFKTFCAVLIVTNTWNIVMAVFDVAQNVVSQSAGVIISDAGIDISGVTADLETQLADWSIGALLGLWFQSIFVGLCTQILSICIFLVIYGRMIERMVNLTFLVMHMAETRQKLEIAVSQAASVAQTYNCQLSRLDFQQEDGLMSSLPLGLNRIRIERSLTTSALAVFVPFVTQELFMGGDAMYYGLNALSNNMILLDRKQSRSPNGLVFGTPGSGKSMSCKREITFIILTTKDNVIICDPEDEYSPLVRRLGGQVIRLSPSSTDYVNPLDINLNYSDEENPLALKSDFVLSFCELIMGSKTGLEAIEKTVIDRAVQKIYQPYFADPRPENMPILGDLMEALLAQGIPEADRVAQALDLYVNGSLNFFNHRTTVDIRNRLVCFDIKGLGKNLKKPGMLIVQEAVWNTVTINRAIGRSTWYFVDEFHLLLKEEQTAAYSAEIWKRFRKWGGVPTGATQNPKDLLSSPEIENILENSDFIYMLNQAAGDRKILAERLGISAEQLAYVTNSEPGHGLLFFNNVILPFADDFPKDTELYRLLTTKPSEVEHAAETEA